MPLAHRKGIEKKEEVKKNRREGLPSGYTRGKVEPSQFKVTRNQGFNYAEKVWGYLYQTASSSFPKEKKSLKATKEGK